MFKAAHITLIQIYPFPEPVFKPDSLAKVGLWARILKRNRREQKHSEIFRQRASLRAWIRNGNPLEVPNLGIMKALRKPDLPYDRFYRPFFQLNKDIDQHLHLAHGPMPFYPIQVLLREQNAALRHSVAVDQAAWEAILGQELRTWSMEPLLVIYPAGCISAQFRLYVETKEPLTAENLRKLVKHWEQWRWRLRFQQAGETAEDWGPVKLLDKLAQQFRKEIVSDRTQDKAGQCYGQGFILINVQGSLHDDSQGVRHKEAQRWMTRLAGIDYKQAEEATVWGAREHEQTPWMVLGNTRAVLAVDDAVRQHIRHYRTDNNILEARRTLRNRTISTLEMALATQLLYASFGNWLEAEWRAWTLESLQSRSSRIAKFFQQPQLSGRILGTLFYELACIPEHLKEADPRNQVLWLSLFQAILKENMVEGVKTESLIATTHEVGTKLRDEIRERHAFQAERMAAGLELIKNLADLLSIGAGGSAAVTPPAHP